MAYVLHLLLALASLPVAALVASSAPAPEGALLLAVGAPWSALGLLLVPHLLGTVAGLAYRRGRVRVGRLFERALEFAAVALQWAAVLGFGWLESTGAMRGLGGWPGPALFVAVAPFVIGEVVAIDARARLLRAERGERRGARVFQLRLFVAALAPFALYVGASWLIGLHEPTRVLLEEVALAGAAYTALIIVAFALVVPRLLVSAWETEPLPVGELRTRLEALAHRVGFRCRNLFVWRTGGNMANAAIVGFTPRTRAVVFTDALCATLDPVSISAVFAHEMGHAKRHHGLLFAAHTVAVFVAADLAVTWLTDAGSWQESVVLAVGLVVWFVTFRSLSRRCELEADLESLFAVGSSAPLVRALFLVTDARSYRRSSWRHYSTETRVRFLQAVELDPAAGERLQRALRRARLAIGFALVVGLGLEVARLAEGWPVERVVADLRLGRFEAAAGRVEPWASETAADRLPEEAASEPQGEEDERDYWRHLATVAAEIPLEARSAEALEARALAAFRDRRDAEAVSLIELAFLRGRRGLGGVLVAFDQGSPGELAESGREDLPITVPGAWYRAIVERFPRAAEALSADDS